MIDPSSHLHSVANAPSKSLFYGQFRKLLMNWDKIRAAKKVARVLPGELKVRYGFSKTYTLGQITVTCEIIKLKTSFLAIAYAQYLDLTNYLSVDKNFSEIEYLASRELVSKYKLAQLSAGAQECPINTYVGQITSLDR